MNKKIIIVIILIIIVGMSIFLLISKLRPKPPVAKCGDGICQPIERQRGTCPQDCKPIPTAKTCSEQGGTICSPTQKCVGSWLKASDTDRCCRGKCQIITPPVIDYEDSPFGIFAAFSVNEFGSFNRQMGFTKKEDYWDWAEYHVRNLGVHWTRSNIQLVWDIVEPEIGNGYQWDNDVLTDPIIKRIYSSGNQVNWIGVFHEGGTPDQALRNPLDYPNEYKAFVRAAVERYDGDGFKDADENVHVKYWQAGNEIHIWKASRRTLQEYIQFVRLVRKAVKEADPEAKVVLIASTNGFEEDPFLKTVIEELAPNHEFDVVDIHHWRTAQDWKMTALTTYRALLDSKGLTDVPIWSCEHGTWQGQPKSQPYQTEQNQAVSLIKRYVFNIANGLDKLFWNNLMEWDHFEGQEGSIFNSIGLVSDGKGPGEDPNMFNVERLAYYTYKLMVEKLEGSDWDNIQTIQESDDIYIYKFTNNGKPIWVAWNDNPGEKQVIISGITSNQVKITEAVPNAESGADLNGNDYPNFFNTETKTVSNGKVTITLEENPVFVEEQ